jgi:hypothetical protein
LTLYIQLIDRSTKWAMLDHPPAPTYYSSNITILGDAARAMAGKVLVVDKPSKTAWFWPNYLDKSERENISPTQQPQRCHETTTKPESYLSSQETLKLYALNGGVDCVVNGDALYCLTYKWHPPS